MKRHAVILVHGGYWALYVLGLVMMLLMLRVPGDMAAPARRVLAAWPLIALAVLPSAVAFYAGYGFLFSRFLERRRAAAGVLAAVGVVLAAAAAGLALALLLFGGGQPAFSSLLETLSLVVLLGGIASVHLAAGLVLRGFVRWYHEVRIKETLARKNREAELALIRAKLDPHFLFNTLNNIDVLIGKDPAAASRYLNELCAIMRFVLYDATGSTVPLGDELTYIERYIALQRIRSRREACVAHEVVGDPSGLSIAPMTFIPFIENAFKHASLRADRAIVSRIAIDGRRVVFECRNRCDAGRPSSGAASGLGRDLIRQRLALLYPGRHALVETTDGGHHAVQLTIDTP